MQRFLLPLSPTYHFARQLESKFYMDKISYSLGLVMGDNLTRSGVRELTEEDFLSGLRCALSGAKPEIDYSEAARLLDSYFSRLMEERYHDNMAAGQAFLEANGRRSEVTTLPSGVQYEILEEGEGEVPSSAATVRCHYEGTRIDGEVFDSSYRRGEPASFPVRGVIRGWQEVLTRMPVGSKWRVVIPQELAYGKQGAGQQIEPYMALVFVIELLAIEA